METHLSASALFSGLTPKELAVVEQAGRRQHVDTGSFIFMEGDPADRFLLVLSGKVKILKTALDGKEQILLLAGPGESFGEAALFTGRQFPASAQAVADSTVMSFPRESFLGLVRQHPVLALNMIAGLSMRLHHLTHLVQQLSLEDITTRLAGYLLDQLSSSSHPSEPVVHLSEKKMTLASILGTIPETLSRAFARLTRLGIIAVDGEAIIIRDRQKLADLASGKKL
ncbi:MAG: Crp/Fnr family transcriptional regulator [candidate division Zixibacteria bacterium]|nr:Crp/Fnr family transcriptional regulator [candidate division Zixibacteria bacterium]